MHLIVECPCPPADQSLVSVIVTEWHLSGLFPYYSGYFVPETCFILRIALQNHMCGYEKPLHFMRQDPAVIYRKTMASTLGVLDVLSRLREESERAATALAAQEVSPMSFARVVVVS